MVTATNPILKGFYPDPSICRVGEDFYLVHSSFAYFPGVPIFHSKDLVNWEQISHVLDRKSQLPLENCGHSRGIFAPTIRYHLGKFYMITTNVSSGGNFIVTANEPTGPWSEPYYLGEEAQGIDPSLFFDEDGTCYYVGTRPNQEGVRYNGDWEIWVQEVDLTSMKLVGESTKLWKGALNGVIWPEGPHFYKKGDYYYLMIAEGGTGPNHSITVARSKKVTGPYENNPNNPILTHRHLGNDYPIRYVGHGDLIDDINGNWYVVMLASRPYKGYTNLGRETFIAKVTWEQDWPVINAGIGKLEQEVILPLEEVRKLPKSSTYHFTTNQLDFSFVMLRNPKEKMYSLTDRENYLRLFLFQESLKEESNPSYLAVRQKDYFYQASTYLEFEAEHELEEAGLCVLQSNLYHVRFVKRKEENKEWIMLIICENGVDKILIKEEVNAKKIELKIVNRGQEADFYYRVKEEFKKLLENVDMHLLSTEIAGGFTGCTIGMYATSNGNESSNYADFAWLSYENLN